MRMLATVLLVTAVGAASTVAAASAAIAPKLRLVSQQPLVVRGDGFRPSERVVLTALTPSGAKRAVVRASTTGRLRMTFRLANQPCGRAFGVSAVGGLGSRATLRVPGPPCVPPPID